MKTIRILLLTLMIVPGMILSGCAGRSSSPDLQGSSWKLVSYGSPQSLTAAAAGIETHLDFSTDGRVTGNMGCNSFGGNYELKNGQIVVSQMISSMMACLGPQMDQERTTLQVLRGSANYQIKNNQLLIQSSDGAKMIVLSR
jgi:heat shock protein HslJ